MLHFKVTIIDMILCLCIIAWDVDATARASKVRFKESRGEANASLGISSYTSDTMP